MDKQMAIKQFTNLMISSRPFSYLRMGDGELTWLLAVQEGKEKKPLSSKGYNLNKGASVNSKSGVRGLETKDFHRLLTAYENCTYLDLYQKVAFNSKNLHRLKLNRSSNGYTTTLDTSNLIASWLKKEFAQYINNRRCLFASAESPVLEKLYQDQRYRQLATDYWPTNAKPVFTRIRHDGRYYWQYLDEIKADLKQDIEKYQIDTLFLSLGSGAKILCYEIAEEMGIATIDFGARIRSLAYLGSYGYQVSRTSYHPFLLRVPFPIVMEAIEKAYPEMTNADLLSRAHAQLCLELATAMKQSNNTTMDIFWEAYRYYKRYYKPLATGDADATAVVKDFQRYRRYNGLGIDGQIFLFFYKLKQKIKSLINLP